MASVRRKLSDRHRDSSQQATGASPQVHRILSAEIRSHRFNSADLTHTAREILASSVRYTGQRPTTVSRVFIVKGMADLLIDTLAESWIRSRLALEQKRTAI